MSPNVTQTNLCSGVRYIIKCLQGELGIINCVPSVFSALDVLTFSCRSNYTVPNFNTVLLKSHKNYPGHISPNSKDQQLQKLQLFLWPLRILDSDLIGLLVYKTTKNKLAIHYDST